MSQKRIKVVLAVFVFVMLAVLTAPWTLRLWLPESYIGEPEEQRYFGVLSWLAVSGALASLGLGIRGLSRVLTVGLYLVAVAISVEFLSAIVVFKTTRQSHLPRWESAFTFHPTLIGVPTPGYYKKSRDGIVIKHNLDGFRGDEIQRKKPERTRIVTIGGSTTYGTMLSNEDVWPHKLGQMLGDRFDVLNLGIPGHSSAEHLILTSLRASDFDPDIIIYYMGWNDLRSAHLATLRSDYSNFHMLEQFSNLGVEKRYRATLATLFLLKWGLVKAGQLDPPKDSLKDARGELSSAFDGRLVPIYSRNIALLAAASRTIGAEPVFVPQVLNQKFAIPDHTTPWVPWVPVTAIYDVNTRMNDVLRATARDVGARLIDLPKLVMWKPDDFLDHGHFTVKGSEKFARVLSTTLTGSQGSSPQ